MHKSIQFKYHTLPEFNARSVNQSTVDLGLYHMSYNPSNHGYGCATTAIVLMDSVFLVLNGDHKEQLQDAAIRNGVHGCIDYFIQNIASANKMSEHLMITGIQDDRFGLKKYALKVLGNDYVEKLRCASLPLMQ